MKDFFTIIIVTLLVVFVYTGVSVIGDDVIDNPNLDTESVNYILSINYELDTNFNESQFDESTSDLAGENATFDNQDTFSKEFLESQASAEKKVSIVKRITKVPDIILIAVGIDEDYISAIKWIIVTLLGIFIAFATYRAFFGGGKVTEN